MFCIVIPTYNNGRYAIENLKSVARQNYNNWKAIIINDNSTDSRKALIVKFIKDNKLEQKVTFTIFLTFMLKKISSTD